MRPPPLWRDPGAATAWTNRGLFDSSRVFSFFQNGTDHLKTVYFDNGKAD